MKSSQAEMCWWLSSEKTSGPAGEWTGVGGAGDDLTTCSSDLKPERPGAGDLENYLGNDVWPVLLIFVTIHSKNAKLILVRTSHVMSTSGSAPAPELTTHVNGSFYHPGTSVKIKTK